MVCRSSDKPKQKHKKGLWSPDEDSKLRNYVLKHGYGCWTSVPVNAGLQRNGKSCRLRWINYLRPGLKRGLFSKEEEELILSVHASLGNKWSQIAQHLPGRTDNEIKNHWHSYLKKKEAKMGQAEEALVTEETSSSLNCLESSSSSAKSATPNSAAESAEHLEGSLMSDTEQSLSQAHMDFPRDVCKSNLPKVMFAEWLSLDQFREPNNFENNSGNAHVPDRDLEYYNSEFQDDFMHDLLLQGGETFSCGPISGAAATDGILQQPLKFEDHISEHGFVGFINGQFNLTPDGLFL